MLRLLIIFVAFISIDSLAATATATWPPVIKHCNGTDIPPGKLDHYDLIHSTSPIDIPAIDPCTTTPQPVPEGVSVSTVNAGADSISLEVDATVTNYFAIRACKAVVCSIFSAVTVVQPVVASPPEEPEEPGNQPYQPVQPSKIIITFDL